MTRKSTMDMSVWITSRRQVSLHHGIKARIIRFKCKRDARSATNQPEPSVSRITKKLHDYLHLKYPYLRLSNVKKWVKKYSWITDRDGIPPGEHGQKLSRKVRDVFAAEQAGRNAALVRRRVMRRVPLLMTDDEDGDVNERASQLQVAVIPPNVPNVGVNENLIDIADDNHDVLIQLTPAPKNTQIVVAVPAPVNDSVIIDPFGDDSIPQLPAPMDVTIPRGGYATILRRRLFGDRSVGKENQLVSDPLRLNDPDWMEYQLNRDNNQHLLDNRQASCLGNTLDHNWISDRVDQLKKPDLDLLSLTSSMSSTNTTNRAFFSTPPWVSDTSNVKIDTCFEDIDFEEDSSGTIVNSVDSFVTFLDTDASPSRPSGLINISSPLDNLSSVSDSSVMHQSGTKKKLEEVPSTAADLHHVSRNSLLTQETLDWTINNPVPVFFSTPLQQGAAGSSRIATVSPLQEMNTACSGHNLNSLSSLPRSILDTEETPNKLPRTPKNWRSASDSVLSRQDLPEVDSFLHKVGRFLGVS